MKIKKYQNPSGSLDFRIEDGKVVYGQKPDLWSWYQAGDPYWRDKYKNPLRGSYIDGKYYAPAGQSILDEYNLNRGELPEATWNDLDELDSTGLRVDTAENYPQANNLMRELYEKKVKEYQDAAPERVMELSKKINDLGLSEADNPRDFYAVGATPEEMQQWDDSAFATTIGGLGVLSLLPFASGLMSTAATYGWPTALAAEAASTGLSYGGYYAGDKLGEFVDNKFGTKTRPWLSTIGGLWGGIHGYNSAIKDAIKASKWLANSGIKGYSEFKPGMVDSILNYKKPSAEPLLNVGWAPKQRIPVTRAGEYDQLFYPERWDVVNEGANPFGIWLQGKWGVPRTNITNPGKGDKAARARKLFADRPQYFGEVTLDKPLQTIGEVGDRSALSYAAERMGADGIIYNDVYDNGFNHNQVIHSFKKFNESKPWKGTGNPTINPDYDDAIAIRDFAKQFGYKIPIGIERYSGELLDNYYKKILRQHNTFGRGVNQTDPELVTNRLLYPFSESRFHGESMPMGQNGIYTLAGTSDYGTTSGVIQRQMDFTGPRNTWISKNTVTPRLSSDVNRAITTKTQQNPELMQFLRDGDYDGYWNYLRESYPKLFDSRGRIFAQNLGSNSGTFIIGGVDGQPIGTVRNTFQMYSPNPTSSTRGFTKMRAKPLDILENDIRMLDDGTITGFKKGGKIQYLKKEI